MHVRLLCGKMLIHAHQSMALHAQQVLVQNISTSVNPVDWKIREGAFGPAKLPKVLLAFQKISSPKQARHESASSERRCPACSAQEATWRGLWKKWTLAPRHAVRIFHFAGSLDYDWEEFVSSRFCPASQFKKGDKVFALTDMFMPQQTAEGTLHASSGIEGCKLGPSPGSWYLIPWVHLRGDHDAALVTDIVGHDAGAYADYVICREEWLALAPPNLKLDTAAGAVPLVALTAFQVGVAHSPLSAPGMRCILEDAASKR